jgi:hypothetical protein
MAGRCVQPLGGAILRGLLRLSHEWGEIRSCEPQPPPVSGRLNDEEAGARCKKSPVGRVGCHVFDLLDPSPEISQS